MCLFTCIIMAIVWFLLGSFLLFFTWNKVVSEITKLGMMKFWQALLVILTLIVLCAPKYAMKAHKMKCYTADGCPISKSAEDCPLKKKK